MNRILPRSPGRAAFLALIALLLVAPTPATPARAQPALSLRVTPAFEGNYSPDRWLPLFIVLRNDGPPAQVLLAAAQPGASARNTLTLDLAGTSETRATLYAAMGQQAREIHVTVEQAGAVVAEQTVPVRPREAERIIAIVSAQPLSLSLPRRQDLAMLPFLPVTVEPAALPDQPAGLSSLPLILLNGVATESLSPAQRDALTAWVRNGGHLVLGGGPGLPATLAGLPAELQAATPGGLAQIPAAPLAGYTGADAPAQIEGQALAPPPDGQPFGERGSPLWVRRDVGLGRVTQLAFDPGLSTLEQWPGAPALWDRLLVPVTLYGSAFSTDAFPDLLREQTLANALGNLPAVNLPGSGLLFGLLVLYALLIGPGMALLLRRIDRQELGWLALPAAALLILTLSSLFAVSRQADQRIVSQITLVEQVDADTARARTALGIITPRDERFALDLSPSALVRPVQPGSSQYGPIGAASGDMVQANGQLQIDVASWEIQGVLVEDLIALPALDAEIRLGETAITALVRNTTGLPLRDVVVAYADQVVSIGSLGQDEEGQASWPLPIGVERPDASTPLSVLVLGEELAQARSAGGQVDRRLLIREALIIAAVGRGSAGDDPGPLVLAWPQRNPMQLQVEADGAASQQIGLLVGRPRIVGAGPVFVPPGWARLQPASGDSLTCNGPIGRGLVSTTDALTMTLALPPDLASFRASDMTLELQSANPWPNAGVSTELYSWPDDRWVEVDFDGPGSLVIPQAGPYLSGGRMQLRLGGRIDEAGCVSADLRMRGELPAQQ